MNDLLVPIFPSYARSVLMQDICQGMNMSSQINKSHIFTGGAFELGIFISMVD